MNVVPAGASETQSHSKYDRLIAAAKAVPPVPTIVVVSPCDETSSARRRRPKLVRVSFSFNELGKIVRSRCAPVDAIDLVDPVFPD